MLYCFNGHHFIGADHANQDINYAKEKGVFIYYDELKQQFFDSEDKEISVKGKHVMPVSFIKNLRPLIKALTEQGAIIPNTLEEIKMVEEWYKYIEVKRLMIPFKGEDLDGTEFLQYIAEVLPSEAFLKTRNKDFSGIIDIEDLIRPRSALRQAFNYHKKDEFMLSEKVDINYDELGILEYRVFVYKKQIMNISRITDNTYHQIPESLIEYLEELMHSLPSDFPSSYVVDIFSYQNMYDVVEFNPIESSGKYLYNSIFSISDDLTHQNIENIPSEKYRDNLTYKPMEALRPSTLKDVPKTFAKDYHDIRRYGRRMNGFIHISGVSEDAKIDIDAILRKTKPLQSDADLTDSTKKV